MKSRSDAPTSLYDTARNPKTLDDAWRLVEAHLPDGWRLIEVCYLAADAQPWSKPRWYAAAHDPTRPDGEHIEGEGDTPVRALLHLARRLHERKHRIGRPPKERLPDAPPRPAGRESGYRSNDWSVPAAIGS